MVHPIANHLHFGSMPPFFLVLLFMYADKINHYQDMFQQENVS